MIRSRHDTCAPWPIGLLCCAAIALLVPAGPSSAEPPAPRQELVLGMSTALTGPASRLGVNMRAGIDGAFAEANKAGGINGRTVRVVALDDGYEPSRTAPNMTRLIEEEKVIGIIGNVGTPTAVVAIPIARQAGTVFFGAFTGAGVLRKTPPERCVINYRASYAEETGAIVDALIDHAGVRVDEIAFFSQRDAYGDAGFVGGVASLKRRGLPSDAAIAHGRYERNTHAVEEAVAEMLAARKPPRAIIMVATAKPSAAFVRLCRANGLNVPMVGVSFVGATELAELLGSEASGVFCARVVPPLDPSLPIIRDYLAVFPDPAQHRSAGVLEGFIIGRIACLAMKRMTGEPSREALLSAFESLGEFDLGLGARLKISTDEHQACHIVWASRLANGAVHAMQWREIGARPEPAERTEAPTP